MNDPKRQEEAAVSPAPCRLSVLLARDAPVGVIFRRGPSKWVQVIRWRVDEDVFEAGQWFHGRIEPKDLSPDGRHLLYFARKETRRQLNSDIGSTWMAISRPPYLTALTLWQEYGSQGAGGVFADNETVILARESVSPHPPFVLPPPLRVRLTSEVESETGQRPLPSASPHWSRGRFDLYEKSVYSLGRVTFWNRHTRWRIDASGRFVLTKTITYTPPYESLTLTDYAALTETPFPGGTSWADFDHRNRLAWTQNGRLWAMPLPESHDARLSLTDATPLADFNAAKPESIPAPDWAKEW